jgi:outer membrane protein OmpA-like peptidoglycan-associated protein
MRFKVPSAPRRSPNARPTDLVLVSLVLVLAVVVGPARAADLSGTLEPGLTVPLTPPQSEIFRPGVGQTLKLLFGVTPYLDVGPAAQFIVLQAGHDGEESGALWTLGGGARLKWPHDSPSFWGLSPWVDVDALYVRTGALHRPGFDVAAGITLPLDFARTVRVGPFVRYTHVVQIDRVGADNHDAKLLTVGVGVEFGNGAASTTEPPPTEVSDASHDVTHDVTHEVTREVCSDGDDDGVPDVVDRCPEVKGVSDAWGCPAYQKVVVQKDKLELKEKLYFAWDAATLEPASYPVLDEVVQALQDNRGFRVQVEGHTDSTGGDDHNQTLSEQRAAAVVDYLVAHGIGKDRLVAKGFASSVPTDTNGTVEGRENNRRVEFVVSFIILDKASTK